MTNAREIIELFMGDTRYSKHTQEEFREWLIDSDMQQHKQEVLQELFVRFVGESAGVDPEILKNQKP